MSIEPFILNALMGGTLIALMGGVLGCFVVWQRLSYYGDTVAHAALLGVAAALIADAPIAFGVISVALLVGGALFMLQKSRQLANDALLGVLAHTALALGMVSIALSGMRVDLNAYLFGDILAISRGEVQGMALACVVLLGWVAWQWRQLMMLVLHEDIAQAEGVRTGHLRLMLMLVIALVVAVSLKVSGMLLVTALLIIPAAAARFFARTPLHMVIWSCVSGVLSIWGGVAASMQWDTPTGPTIILAAAGFFVLARASFTKL